MTRRVTVSYTAIAGTEAGFGRSGNRSLIADRPEGVAGGSGLGFTGAELLAASLGGCLWNDLHHVAHAAGVPISVAAVEASVELAGNPPRVVRAQVGVRMSGAPDATLREILAAASETSTIAASLRAAFPVHVDWKP